MEPSIDDISDAFAQLLEVSRTLRGPDGCPWDKSREPEDFKTDLVEEVYELLDAMNGEDRDKRVDELGDVLYQVVFLTEVYNEAGTTDLKEVLDNLRNKLVRRHPHVFGDQDAGTPEEVVRNWEEIKRNEKKENGEESVVLSGVPRKLPAMLRAYRLTEKAASAGFQWDDEQKHIDKIDEEFQEVKNAMSQGDSEGQREELGDLLFALANLARRRDIDPEEALQGTNEKFINRFKQLETKLKEEGISVEEAGKERLLAEWNRISSST